MDLCPPVAILHRQISTYTPVRKTATTSKLIFISCGQLTEAEKSVGVLLKAVVDGAGAFRAYFAETVHDLDGLAHNVLEGIQSCSGAIIVLQDRGLVTQSNGKEWGRRSSVWVNQEIAILAYRQFFESKAIPILAFMDPAVEMEGAMTSLIVNAQTLPTSTELASTVRRWLDEADFSESSNSIFFLKWERLTESARMVVAGLLEEGGKNAKESSIRQTLMRRFSVDANSAGDAIRNAKLQFINTDLVKLIPNRHSGDELSVNPVFEFLLRKECAKWVENLRRD